MSHRLLIDGTLVASERTFPSYNPATGEVQVQKTYAFHPMAKSADGTIGVAMNVTHVIPGSYMMQAALDRILAEAEKAQKKAIVGMIYRGQVKTRSGFRVNDIGIFEKYV